MTLSPVESLAGLVVCILCFLSGWIARTLRG